MTIYAHLPAERPADEQKDATPQAKVAETPQTKSEPNHRAHRSTADTKAKPYRGRRLVALPEAPTTTSPLPWLTSIHAAKTRGPYGQSAFPGNCGGYLIKDLLRFFGAKNVLDPMSGSGTCSDVCRELGIACISYDLRSGFDACDPKNFPEKGIYDFIWLHPPYWQQIKYNDDDRCLSSAPTLRAFLGKFRALIANCRNVLTEHGKLAILMGDYEHKGMQMPLTYFTVHLALQENFWPACTPIMRMLHGCSSSNKTYNRSFIPGLHDVCYIFRKK